LSGESFDEFVGVTLRWAVRFAVFPFVSVLSNSSLCGPSNFDGSDGSERRTGSGTAAGEDFDEV
jgi:hypothetical protein